MSSLRPEEGIRKAIKAGYGNLPDTTLAHDRIDDTEVLCKATVALDLGDWVSVSAGAAGYMTCAKPTEDGASDWIGVVQHKVDADDWVRVKTCGVGLAKVDDNTTKTAGDPLEVVNGQVYAQDAEAGSICGRFLRALAGDQRMSWVSIGGGPETRIKIHHHTDEDNTEWVDVTAGTSDAAKKTGFSWNLFKVMEDAHTSGTQRLMLAVGGHDSHGVGSYPEGWCWGGVIGDTTSLGIGKIGGPSSNNHQGVLGLERAISATVYRVNFRSWGHWNARDRYPTLTAPDGIGPIRFSSPPHVPKWYVPTTCDDTPPVIPTGGLWWEGTMIYSATLAPANGTGLTKQWAPALLAERNCQHINIPDFTGVDECLSFPCGTIANPSQLYSNIYDLRGSYENVIPYGYTPCTGRHDELTAITMLLKHLYRYQAWMMCWMQTVDQALYCLDQNGINLKTCVNNTFGTKLNGSGTPGSCVWPPCCDAVDPVTIPALDYGPASIQDCEDTSCD